MNTTPEQAEQFKRRIEAHAAKSPRWRKFSELTREYAEEHPGLIADYLALRYRDRFDGYPPVDLPDIETTLGLSKDEMRKIDRDFIRAVQPKWFASEEYRSDPPADRPGHGPGPGVEATDPDGDDTDVGDGGDDSDQDGGPSSDPPGGAA